MQTEREYVKNNTLLALKTTHGLTLSCARGEQRSLIIWRNDGTYQSRAFRRVQSSCEFLLIPGPF